jgi:hypothetical protein
LLWIQTKHYDALGAHKIERLFKLEAFLIEANLTPPQKRCRLNMDISPGESQVTCNRTPPSGHSQPGRGNGRDGSHVRGRGNYNKNY